MRLIPEKEELQGMYNDQKLTMSEIGLALGVSYGTISKWMTYYQIHRRTTGECLKGKPKSIEHRKNLSISKRGPKHPNFGKKGKIHGTRHWYTCPDGKVVSMRSTWEVCYAEYLKKQGVSFLYEPITFTLPDGAAYTPDFLLLKSETFVEVKGWLTPEHRERIRCFKEAFPEKPFILADKQYLQSLGIDLKVKWVSTRPLFKCDWCQEPYHRVNTTQKFCSVSCRNKAVANGHKSTSPDRKKRKYTKTKERAPRRDGLKPEQVLEIRELHELGYNNSEIARKVGATPGNISNIVRGKSWTMIR